MDEEAFTHRLYIIQKKNKSNSLSLLFFTSSFHFLTQHFFLRFLKRVFFLVSCQNISQAINFQNLTLKKKKNFAETSSYMCHLIILIFQFSMFAFSQDYSNNDVFSISSNFLIFYSSKYTVFRPSNPFIRFSSCSLLFFVFFFFWLLLLVSSLLLFYLT